MFQSWAKNFYVTTDAEFRAFCQQIEDKILAGGLAHSTDTGQMDLTTVLRPTAINQDRGYRIYEFTDALQATSPVKIKINFRSVKAVQTPIAGRDSFGFICLVFQVGWGSDGAGNLIDPCPAKAIAPDFTITSPGNNTTVYTDFVATNWLTSANNRLCVVFGIDSNWNYSATTNLAEGALSNFLRQSGLFVVERGHNSDGSDKDDKIIIAHAGTMNENAYNSGHLMTYVMNKNKADFSPYPAFQCLWLYSGTTFFYNTAGLMPIYPMNGIEALNPFLSIAGCWKTDLFGLTPFEHYGQQRFFDKTDKFPIIYCQAANRLSTALAVLQE